MHPFQRIAGLTIVTLVLTATAAQAATVYTPPLSAEAGGEHRCWVMNASPQPREARIEIVTAAGVVLHTVGPFTFLPGRAVLASSADTSRSFCRVTVKGGKTTVRVSLESRINNDTIAAVNGY